MSFFSQLQQNVIVSAGNSSTANLGPGATFTGTSQTTLGVVGIQVNLIADQNCNVYVDQSMNGIDWDITDHINYRHIKGGQSWTVQATASYCRVRVTNIGASATTFLRLQTALCPIVEAVPRALSEEGNLKVGVYEIEGDLGIKNFISPMGSLSVHEHVRLVGANFTTTLDANFWTQTTLTGSATSTVANSVLTMSTGTTTASSNVVNSRRRGRYIGGSGNYFRGVVRLPAVVGVNTRRWGAFDANDGFFFEHNGTLLSIVARKGGVDTKVDSGDFNGYLGDTVDPGVNVGTYEIHWTNSKAWFFYGGELVHTLSGTLAMLSNTLSLPVGLENTNGANINDNQMLVRVATIQRSGMLQTQTQYARINTTGVTVLKYGPGNLHSIVFGTLPAASGTITIYDNTTNTGTVIHSATINKAVQASALPLSVDFKGLPFNTGLTIDVVTNAADFTVIYE